MAHIGRRKFLAGVAVAGAATAAAPQKKPIAAPMADRGPSGLPPSAQLAAAETAVPKELPRAHAADGSDFMVDVIKTLDFEYLPANPASSFRGLHESLIDYGGNKKPEFLTCMHEEFGRRDGARLFQGHRQAAHDIVPRHRRPAARHDGDLQCLVRPRAGHRHRRHRSRRGPPSARRADRPLGAGHQRAGARLHQMGRHAGLAAALRAVLRARLQDRDDAADGAGRDRARRRSAAGADPRERRAIVHPALRARRRRRRAKPVRSARRRGSSPMPSGR